jgi:hypothetical protein
MTEPTPAPTPSSGASPLADAGRLVRVLFSPGAVYDELKERPSFWVPWIVVSIVYAAINWFQRPFTQRIQAMALEKAGQPVPTPGAVGAIVSVVLTPVGVLVLCAISAGIFYLLVSAMGGETSFKKMLTLVIFVFPITLIQTLLTVIVLHLRGVESIQSAGDLMVSFGADLLVPNDVQMGYFVRILLMGIGPLAIWSLAIQATGLQALAKLGKGGAWAAALIAYAILLCIGAGFGAWGMKMAGA